MIKDMQIGNKAILLNYLEVLIEISSLFAGT
jgi:hypothetical protein